MKKRLTGYTFDASEKTVTHADFSDITLEGIQLIVNTTDQIIIYNFADTTKGGTLSTDTLTLEYDTTTMDDADKLMILVDDAATTQVVSAASLPLPSGASTSAKQDTGNTSLASIDGKITAVNTGAVVVSSSALPSGAATAALQTQPGVDIGDVTVNNASGAAAVNIQDGGNSITIDGTVVATQSTASNLNAQVVGSIADAGTDSGNPVKVGGRYNSTKPTYTDGQRGDLQLGSRGSVAMSLFVNDSTTAQSFMADNADGASGSATANKMVTIDRNTLWNGSTWDRMYGDTTNGLDVDVTRLPTLANVTTVGTVSTLTGGGVAHDGVDSGNPIKTGGQARTTNPSAVADADRTNFIADKLGKQVVVGSIRDLKADQATTITSSTTETTIVTAIASTFNDLYGLIVTNTSATACEVVFRDVTAGTARFSIHVPATDTRGFMLPESAAYKQATVNTAWTAQCGTSVASIKINALYVKNI